MHSPKIFFTLAPNSIERSESGLWRGYEHQENNYTDLSATYSHTRSSDIHHHAGECAMYTSQPWQQPRDSATLRLVVGGRHNCGQFPRATLDNRHLHLHLRRRPRADTNAHTPTEIPAHTIATARHSLGVCRVLRSQHVYNCSPAVDKHCGVYCATLCWRNNYGIWAHSGGDSSAHLQTWCGNSGDHSTGDTYRNRYNKNVF